MDKLTIFAALGSLTIVACGAEPGEVTESSSQAAMVTDYALTSTAETLAREYVLCLTRDDPAAGQFLENRLAAIRAPDPAALAATAMSEGWCPMIVKTYDDASPAFRKAVVRALSMAGFRIDRPFTRQGTSASRSALLKEVTRLASLDPDIVVLSARLCWLTDDGAWIWISVEPDGAGDG